MHVGTTMLKIFASYLFGVLFSQFLLDVLIQFGCCFIGTGDLCGTSMELACLFLVVVRLLCSFSMRILKTFYAFTQNFFMRILKTFLCIVPLFIIQCPSGKHGFGEAVMVLATNCRVQARFLCTQNISMLASIKFYMLSFLKYMFLRMSKHVFMPFLAPVRILRVLIHVSMPSFAVAMILLKYVLALSLRVLIHILIEVCMHFLAHFYVLLEQILISLLLILVFLC